MSPDLNPSTEPLSELDVTIAGLKKADLVLSRFKLERCLGRGGMGEVWLALDQTLDEKVALKLLPRLIHFDERAVEDLKNETRRGRQLSHPHIVRVFDFYKDANNVAIAMEFVRGENLSVLAAREAHGAFTVEKMALWAQQLLQGLDYAHRSGSVVHRDLKPANLLIDETTSSLKIADFGIARCLADSMQRVTVSAQSRGTLCYMSPEQATGRGANPLDDLYAVGATLYEMLAGVPPFHSGDVFNQILKVPPPPIAERQRELGFQQPPPPHWEAAIMRCLAKERAQRPQSAAEVLDLLGMRGGAPPAVPYSLQANPPATTATLAPASTPSTSNITIGTSAPVLTVPTQNQRPFELRTSGGKTVSTPAATPQVQPPSKTRPGLIAVAAGVVVVLAGAAWWVFNQRQPVPQPSLASGAPAQTPALSPAAGATAPAPLAAAPTPTPGGDWKVPGDFATLQAALDAATQPGQKIVIAAKQWNERLSIKKPVRLVGAGAQQTIVAMDGGGGPVLEILDSAQEVSIEGIGFQHSGDETLLNGQPVARIRGGKVSLHNCAFVKGTDAGLVASEQADLTVKKCQWLENSGPGLKLTSAAKAVVEDSEFAHNDRGAFLELAGTSAVFIRCEFVANAVHGLEVSDQAAVAARLCKFADNLQSGSYILDSGSKGEFDDCDVTGGEQGLQAERGGSLTVTKSRISGATLGVVALEAGTVQVTGSTISGHRSHGVVLTAPQRESGTVQLTDNTIGKNGGMGLIVEGKNTVPDVRGNKIGPNGQIDVLIRGGAGGNFAANTLMSKLDANGHNYYIAPDSPAAWATDNREQPTTP